MLEQHTYTNNQLKLIHELRSIYLNRITLYRTLIISIVNDLDDIQYINNRLQRTSKEIAEFIEKYYVCEIAYEIEKLFSENTQKLVELVYALKERDTTRTNKLKIEIKNGSQGLYQILRKINPNFNELDIDEKIFDYYKMLEILIIKKITKQYYDEIEFYDILEDMVINLTDRFSTGMIEQLKIY